MLLSDVCLLRSSGVRGLGRLKLAQG